MVDDAVGSEDGEMVDDADDGIDELEGIALG